MTKELSELIEAIIADDVITDKERAVLHARAAKEGISADEIDVLVEGKLVQKIKGSRNAAAAPAVPPPVVGSKLPPPVSAAGGPVSQPKRKDSFGVMHKCPNCAAPVEAVTTKCTACGYEFRGVEANSSVRELSERIGRAKNDQKEDIIRNFPVPTTRDDLLEFIFFTKSKAFAFEEGTAPYREKYYECIDKAEYYFRDDPQFSQIIAEGRRNRKKLWKNLNRGVKMTIICIVGYILFMAFLIWFGES